jgi:hypothetical protein
MRRLTSRLRHATRDLLFSGPRATETAQRRPPLGGDIELTA